MTEGRSDGALPERADQLRASDDDRAQVVARLRTAAGEGRIDLDELEERIAATYRAQYLPDLAPITADLPDDTRGETAAGPSGQRRPARPAGTGGVEHRNPLVMEDDEFRSHLTVYVMVIGMLIGIWLLSGAGHFWPFYPAAGWGIGMGAHYQTAITHQRKRLDRARREGIPSFVELDRIEHEEKKAKRKQRIAKVLPHLPPMPQIPGVPPIEDWFPRGDADDDTGDGDAGATAATDPTRRFAAAMFVDVVGSTQLTEALGDEAWAQVRTRFRTLVGECAEAVGGWEANTAGDGVLVRFDDPGAAVRCAIEIQRRLASQRDRTGFAPEVRIGVHSGDAVDDGGDLIGAVVNLASRVTSVAAPGEIVVTEHVADHVDSGISTEDRGLHTLRGISRPRHLLAVHWR